MKYVLQIPLATFLLAIQLYLVGEPIIFKTGLSPGSLRCSFLIKKQSICTILSCCKQEYSNSPLKNLKEKKKKEKKTNKQQQAFEWIISENNGCQHSLKAFKATPAFKYRREAMPELIIPDSFSVSQMSQQWGLIDASATDSMDKTDRQELSCWLIDSQISISQGGKQWKQVQRKQKHNANKESVCKLHLKGFRGRKPK